MLCGWEGNCGPRQKEMAAYWGGGVYDHCHMQAYIEGLRSLDFEHGLPNG